MTKDFLFRSFCIVVLLLILAYSLINLFPRASRSGQQPNDYSYITWMSEPQDERKSSSDSSNEVITGYE